MKMELLTQVSPLESRIANLVLQDHCGGLLP